MTNRWIVALIQVAIVVVALSVAAPSWAGPSHDDIVRPFVMILLDTSGSMEWVPGSNTLPSCTSTPATDERSRWMLLEEVLTGTYTNYSCSLEPRTGDQAGYYIPHVENDNNAQAHDGIMTLYDDEIEFGIMTMDSFPSPDAGERGMWSYPTAADVEEAFVRYEIDGDHGIHWQESATCAYFWNLGVRNEAATQGAMVSHNWGGTSPGSHHSRNVHAQNGIQDIIPYWSSPIGAALYDAYYYFRSHDANLAITGSNPDGDCWANCRPHHVVLITDGLPNNDGQPECGYDVTDEPPVDRACPYPQAWEVADMMYQYDPRIFLHVIGFSALDTNGTIWDSSGNPQAVDVLEHLGTTGWGGSDTDCPTDELGDPECVLYADSGDELREAFGRVFDVILEGTRARTRTATQNAVVSFSSVDAMGQHQLFSSTNITVGGTWEGNLERVTYQCADDGSGDLNPIANGGAGDGQPTIFNYGDEGLDLVNIATNNITTRRLYTTNPTLEVNPNIVTRPLSFTVLDDTIDESHFEVDTPAARNKLLRWMHGSAGSHRAEVAQDTGFEDRNRRLGAIYHTTPVIVGPPSLELPLSSYNVGGHHSAVDPISGKLKQFTGDSQIGFRQLYAKRPHIVYVASTDGILHAFDLNHEYAIGSNPEIWGFVPPMLLPRLRMNLLGQNFLLDGQINVSDVRLRRDITGGDVDEWATVLVMGLRDGGGIRGYFALDVTAPYPGSGVPAIISGEEAGPSSLGVPDDPPYGEPALLWQITPDTLTDPLTTETLANYGGIGLTYSRPTFGTIVMDDEEVAVAFLPGGVRPLYYWDDEDADNDDEFWEDYPENSAIGCGLYVVRLSDGRLIRWLSPARANCTVNSLSFNAECAYAPSATFDCQIVGTPVALGGLPGEITTRVFVGDSQGRLYRADLSNSDPMDWELDPFFSLFSDGEADKQPLYEAPAAAMDHRGLVTLVFGSGDPEDLQARPLNRVASITEMFALGTNSITDGLTCHLDYNQVDTTATGQVEFVLNTNCDTNDRVFPYANWVFPLDDSGAGVIDFSDAGLSAAAGSGGPFEQFVLGERILGSPVIFDEVAYFTTFVPSPDPDDCCITGYGRVLGVHYLGNSTTATTTNDVVRDLGMTESIEVQQMGDNEISYGVNIVRDPSCSDITRASVDDPWIPLLSTATRPRYRLVVHNNSETPAPLTSGDTPTTGYLDITLETPPSQSRFESWVSIFGF